jgi:hypothetical protein
MGIGNAQAVKTQIARLLIQPLTQIGMVSGGVVNGVGYLGRSHQEIKNTECSLIIE